MENQAEYASEFVVRISKGGWGNFERIAVLEVDPGYAPKAIDDRPKAVHRIVWHSGRVYRGTTDKCEAAAAETIAREMARAANAARSPCSCPPSAAELMKPEKRKEREMDKCEEITLTGPTEYNTSYPPAKAKKGYVAKITGRASGPFKFEREFLGSSVTVLEGDEGLYERQIGEKKGGATRYYNVVLSHPEHGLIRSVDCEDELPKIAQALDSGADIHDAVEVTNLRPSRKNPGLMLFDAVASGGQR